VAEEREEGADSAPAATACSASGAGIIRELDTDLAHQLRSSFPWADFCLRSPLLCRISPGSVYFS
jgi:hypothetical protein